MTIRCNQHFSKIVKTKTITGGRTYCRAAMLWLHHGVATHEGVGKLSAAFNVYIFTPLCLICVEVAIAPGHCSGRCGLIDSRIQGGHCIRREQEKLNMFLVKHFIMAVCLRPYEICFICFQILF